MKLGVRKLYNRSNCISRVDSFMSGNRVTPLPRRRHIVIVRPQPINVSLTLQRKTGLYHLRAIPRDSFIFSPYKALLLKTGFGRL